MTERTGGSDVSLTETLATNDPSVEGMADVNEGIGLGPWSVSGFKWFSSATDSNMTILLAKTTPNGKLSAFFAPMRRSVDVATSMVGKKLAKEEGSELNGVRIQRLKDKFGTQSLPTAELELLGMRAWMIGDEGKGIQEISTVLTITRIYSAVAAVGYLGRGLCVAKAYAKVRKVGGGQGKRMLLHDSPLHMRTLADMTAEYHGLVYLTIFSAFILGLSENMDSPSGSRSTTLQALTPKPEHIDPLLRVLTQVMKAYVCKHAIPLLYACMESLGGQGYLLNEELEYLNLARLYRDCCVLAIWEGTTDVLSTDFIRAVKHPRSGPACMEALDDLIRSSPHGAAAGHGQWKPLEAWEKAKRRLEGESAEELVGMAREIVWNVAEILIGILLSADSKRDGSQTAEDIFERFVAVKRLGGGGGMVSSAERSGDRLRRDQAIVYGEEEDILQAKL